MAEVHRRRFDAVVVWKFDRFSRSVSHLLRALKTFNALGITFASPSESLDMATPADKMVFTVLGAVVELGPLLIAERVRAGPRVAWAKGKRLGKPRVSVDAAQIARLRASGASWSDVCTRTGLSKGTTQWAAASLPQNRCFSHGRSMRLEYRR